MSSFFRIEDGFAVLEKDRLSLSEVKKILAALYSSSEDRFFHNGKEYVAAPEIEYTSSPCCGCAFNTCCTETKSPPCQAEDREDGRNIIWVKSSV